MALSLRYRRRVPRGAQLAVVETPEGPLHLVHVHFGLSERERRWQAALLLGHPEFLASAHLPTLIAGDYNDWRNTLGRRCLLAHGFRPATAPIRRFRTFPAFLPLAAIDKVYYRGRAARGGDARGAQPGGPAGVGPSAGGVRLSPGRGAMRQIATLPDPAVGPWLRTVLHRTP